MKQILFRSDSSSSIGTGHIKRDLILAKRFGDAKITFAMRNLAGNINHEVLEAGYALEILKSSSLSELDALVKKLSVDLLIIDHYDIDYKFEKELKRQNPDTKIMVLDDTYQKHHCDTLLNHNIYAKKKRYKSLVPKGCKLLCGSKHTLLRDEFRSAKNSVAKGEQKRIVVAMGGSDSANLSIKILKALKKQSKAFDVDLVTTTANKNLEKLKKWCRSCERVELHIDSNEVANLLKNSTFAIISASSLANEAYYLEVPFVAIKTASNQREMHKWLRKSDHISLKKFSKKKLKKGVKKLIKQEVKRWI